MKKYYGLIFRSVFILITLMVFINSIDSFNYIESKKEIDIFSCRSYYAGLDPFRDIKKFDKYEIQRLEYPVATEIWEYLKLLDYSDEVCSGIIGNMMVECGGGTLYLNPYIFSSNKNYYGICQWSKKYYEEVIGKDLISQLDYLRDNIEYEINTYGKLYKKNFKYNNFLELKNVEQSALCFAKCYERCGEGAYQKRMKCSTYAFNYFTQ